MTNLFQNPIKFVFSAVICMIVGYYLISALTGVAHSVVGNFPSYIGTSVWAIVSVVYALKFAFTKNESEAK